MHSLQGHALVASPYLTDPNFLRSVVYLLRHDNDGAVGLILNRPLLTTVGSLLSEIAGQKIHNPHPVYCGGPVDGPLMLLQVCEGEEAPAIYIASDQERILEICTPNFPENDSPESDYRVFDGYAGWGAQQLEKELSGGGWLVWEIPADQLFADAEYLWRNAIRQIGRDILAGGIDPSKMPEDPAYN